MKTSFKYITKEHKNMYIYTHFIGTFILDETTQIHDIELVNTNQTAAQCEQKINLRHKNVSPLPKELTPLFLAKLKDPKYRSLFHQSNEYQTQEALKETVNEDNLIIQSVSLLDEIDRAVNIISKRLREWHSLTYPELEHKIQDHIFYAKLISEKTNIEIESDLKIKNNLGANLQQKDIIPIKLLANEVINLFKLRKQNEEYLTQLMQTHCPNLTELGGATIAAKLLNHARSLKHLAMLPASTLQLFGAEKALFRHIKTGARSPKYGLIINHPFVQNAKKDEKGKAARLLADKLSLCARLDYFKGEFKAPEYKKELEKKLCL